MEIIKIVDVEGRTFRGAQSKLSQESFLIPDMLQTGFARLFVGKTFSICWMGRLRRTVPLLLVPHLRSRHQRSLHPQDLSLRRETRCNHRKPPGTVVWTSRPSTTSATTSRPTASGSASFIVPASPARVATSTSVDNASQPVARSTWRANPDPDHPLIHNFMFEHIKIVLKIKDQENWHLLQRLLVHQGISFHLFASFLLILSIDPPGAPILSHPSN